MVAGGGLPGLGWTPESKRIAIKGKRDGDAVTMAASDGSFSGEIRGGVLKLLPKAGKPTTLPRVERISPTLGLEPLKGAVVLFDGASADQWKRGRMEDGLLAATNALSNKAFSDYTLHLLSLPSRPNESST